MKLLSIITAFCLFSASLAAYGLYAIVPSSYVSGFTYPLTARHASPLAYRYAVPVGYTHTAPATTTFVKYVEPPHTHDHDHPLYALGYAYLKK